MNPAIKICEINSQLFCSRGRAKTQVSLVPRSIHTHAVTKAASKQEQNEEKGDDEKGADENELANVIKKSNEDFRKLFAK